MSILSIIEDTCKELINIYQVQRNGKDVLPSTMLRFPSYRDSSLRVSEQEARFVFSAVLEKTKEFRYTVETPTLNTYMISGNHKLSARIDMTLWCLEESLKLFNVEFKCHNCRIQSISKDVEKLIDDVFPGIWFHLLENIDTGTLPSLCKKFKDPLMNFGNRRKKAILIVICVLEKELGMIGRLSPNIQDKHDLELFFDEAQELFLKPKSFNGQWWHAVL